MPASAAAILAALVLLRFLPVWLGGWTYFWGDLTYLHHPWQASLALSLQSGQLPLWDASSYFGMPMAARMQNAAFYPGQLPFFLFGFSDALALFHAAHYWLAGWLMTLWLRSLRLGWAPALGGGILYALGGGLFSRIPFLNHLSTLSLLPATLLFFRRPALLGLTLAAAFLAGFPPIFIGLAAAAWSAAAVAEAGRGAAFFRDAARAWVVAGVLAAALAACLLIPGAELFFLSRRASGIPIEEALLYGYNWRDLLGWVSPLLTAAGRYAPAMEWWKCSWLGFAGAAAALWGLARLPRRERLGAALLLAGVGALMLGSRWAWEALPPLKLIRYPGNLFYLALPLLSYLAAKGLSALPPRWRAAALLAMALELSLYAAGSMPLAPRSLFTSAGPLVRHLQEKLEGGRYLLSPVALNRNVGAGVFDWKHRLYGISNAPYRLRAAANFGDPLSPTACFKVMDFLFTRPGADAAAEFFPWLGIRYLLTPLKVEGSNRLVHEETLLWELYRTRAPASSAWLFDETGGSALSFGLPLSPPTGPARPLESRRAREDLFEVSGEGPGWLFLAEPLLPGWKARLLAPEGERPLAVEPAWLAFQKARVPAGPWTAAFRYDPASWRWGLALTLLSLAALSTFGALRLRRLA